MTTASFQPSVSNSNLAFLLQPEFNGPIDPNKPGGPPSVLNAEASEEEVLPEEDAEEGK